MAPLLQKNLALLQTEAAKDTVDASDVVTAIIEAGESGLDNSGLKKLGDVDDFKEKVQAPPVKRFITLIPMYILQMTKPWKWKALRARFNAFYDLIPV